MRTVEAALQAYEVGEIIGKGQWGIVRGARHRHLGRDVAVKQLPSTYADDPDVVQRFVNEAKVLGSLNHMHIVPVYDFVQHEGLCLLVMERLHGGTLKTRFHDGLSHQDACAVALAAAAALHYAHQHGVLHRDIKPDNIMFSGEGVLKVTDFGIAKVLGGSETVLTRTGLVMGTPAYMAPEQAKGETLTPATDLYALGLILYELLAGKLPFEQGDDPLSLIYRHVYEAPLPLLDAAPDVPPEIAGVVMRALERNPAGRYETAEAFGVSLAASAKEAWGGNWLSQSAITVGAPGPILAAAHGERSAGTVAAPALPRVRPDLGAAANGAAADTLPPFEPVAPVAVEEAQDGPGPGPGPALPVKPLAIAAGLLAAVVLAVVLIGSGKDEPERGSPSGTAGPIAAAGDWRALRDVPTPRQQVGAAVVDGTIWIAGGLAGEEVSRKVEGYDAAINTWKAGPELPVPLHHVSAVAYKGELVVIGGWAPEGGDLSANTSSKVFALRDGKWKALPPLKRARAAAAAAVVGDLIVVTGGQADGELVADTEVFDGTSWKRGKALPAPREHLAAAGDGRYAYVVGGRELGADKNSDRLDRYDPAADRWERLPDMPTARGGLAAAMVEGNLVTVGGEQTTGVDAKTEVYDPRTRRWTEAPDLGTGRHGLAAVAVGTSLYALAGADKPTHATAVGSAELLRFERAAAPQDTAGAGGSWRALRDAPSKRQQVAAAALHGTVWVIGGLAGEAASKKVEGFDAAINTWKQGPPLPVALHHATAVAFRDELVVIGGWSPKGGDLSAIVSDKVYALRDGKWVTLAPLEHARAAAAAAVVGDRLVVTGGQAGGKLVPSTEVFDGKQWSEAADLPSPREHLAAAGDDRYAYAVGGRRLAADKNSARVDRFDPATGKWKRLADMPTARGGLGAAIAGGRIVAVGGESTTGVFGEVEVLDLARGRWSTAPEMKTPRHGIGTVAIGRSVYAIAGATKPSHATAVDAAEVLALPK